MDYRIYVIGKDGRFVAVHEMVCDTDEQALAAAEQLLDRLDLELWQKDRRVAVLKADSQSTEP